MNVLFTIPVNETVEELFGVVEVTLDWQLMNHSYSVTGTGSSYDEALEIATMQFNGVMNYMLKLS